MNPVSNPQCERNAILPISPFINTLNQSYLSCSECSWSKKDTIKNLIDYLATNKLYLPHQDLNDGFDIYHDLALGCYLTGPNKNLSDYEILLPAYRSFYQAVLRELRTVMGTDDKHSLCFSGFHGNDVMITIS